MPVTKNAYMRYQIINSLLRHRTYPSRKRIMQALEEEGYTISQNTFEKDLYAMRYQMGHDIRYDRNRGGYYYGDENIHFDIVFSKDELALIWLALAHLKPFEFCSVTRSIRESIEKIAKRMNIPLEKLQSISNKVEFAGIFPNTGIRHNLKTILDAMFYKHKIRFDYFNGEGYDNYTVIPLKLIEDNNEYFWDIEGQNEDGMIHLYRVHKMSDLDITSDRFSEKDIRNRYVTDGTK